jgi:hypothetical protein
LPNAPFIISQEFSHHRFPQAIITRFFHAQSSSALSNARKHDTQVEREHWKDFSAFSIRKLSETP